jgi:hypothetical protein
MSDLNKPDLGGSGGTPSRPESMQAADILSAALQKVQDDARAEGAQRVFFPHGVGLIDATVLIGPESSPIAKLQLKIEGPKPTPAIAEQLQGPISTFQLKNGLWIIKNQQSVIIGNIVVEPNPSQAGTIEHWFYQPGTVDTGNPASITRDPTANPAPADHRVTLRGQHPTWKYIKATCTAPVAI